MSKFEKKIKEFNDTVLFLNMDGSIESVKYEKLKNRYIDCAPEYLLIPVNYENPKFISVDTLCYDIKSVEVTFTMNVLTNIDDVEINEYIYEKVDNFQIKCSRYIDIYRFIHSLITIWASLNTMTPDSFRDQKQYTMSDVCVKACWNNDCTKVKYFNDIDIENFIDKFSDILVGKKESLISSIEDSIIIDTSRMRWIKTEIELSDLDSIPNEFYDKRYMISANCNEFLSIVFVYLEDVMYMSLAKGFRFTFCGYLLKNVECPEDFYLCMRNVVDEDVYEVYDINYKIIMDVESLICLLVYCEDMFKSYTIDKDAIYGELLDGYMYQICGYIPHGDICHYVYICEDIDFALSKKHSVYNRFLKRLKLIMDGKIPKYVKDMRQIKECPDYAPF